MKEIWKDIPGYEGLYQVSNLGRVKSLRFRNNVCDKEKERIMTLNKKDNEYLYVSLSKNGIRSNKYVHRLVATCFIPNDNNYETVNHIDYNVKNNNVNNLEWCSQKQNVFHSISHLKKRKNITHSNTGEKYITYRKKDNVYRITINKVEYPSCKSLEEAIKRRNEILEVIGG